MRPALFLKVEPTRGLDCSGISKPRRISATNGPAAGGGYVLRKGANVKAGRNYKELPAPLKPRSQSQWLRPPANGRSPFRPHHPPRKCAFDVACQLLRCGRYQGVRSLVDDHQSNKISRRTALSLPLGLAASSSPLLSGLAKAEDKAGEPERGGTMVMIDRKSVV